eukprot:9554075-Lingulodinium_polyedra.AAC.1
MGSAGAYFVAKGAPLSNLADSLKLLRNGNQQFFECVTVFKLFCDAWFRLSRPRAGLPLRIDRLR